MVFLLFLPLNCLHQVLLHLEHVFLLLLFVCFHVSSHHLLLLLPQLALCSLCSFVLCLIKFLPEILKLNLLLLFYLLYLCLILCSYLIDFKPACLLTFAQEAFTTFLRLSKSISEILDSRFTLVKEILQTFHISLKEIYSLVLQGRVLFTVFMRASLLLFCFFKLFFFVFKLFQ